MSGWPNLTADREVRNGNFESVELRFEVPESASGEGQPGSGPLVALLALVALVGAVRRRE